MSNVSFDNTLAKASPLMDCVRTPLKYEEVDLRHYTACRQAEDSLGKYFDFYGNERLRKALCYRTCAEVYDED